MKGSVQSTGYLPSAPEKKRTRRSSQFVEPNAPQTMAVASAPNDMARVPELAPSGLVEPQSTCTQCSVGSVAVLVVVARSEGVLEYRYMVVGGRVAWARAHACALQLE